MTDVISQDYGKKVVDDRKKRDAERNIYYNAFPKVQRSQLERRECGETLKAAMEVMDVFEPLAAIHPAVDVAFGAFKVFLQFELDRRQNEDRVMVVIVAQTDMMNTLLKVKDIDNYEARLANGVPLRSKLESISSKIRDLIDVCGNAVDCYYKDSLIRKFAHAKDWKRRLGDFAKKFHDFKVDIVLALQINQSAAAQGMDNKLDEILTRLDHSFERQNSFEKALMDRFGKIKEEDLLDGRDSVLLRDIIEFVQLKDATGMSGRKRKGEGQMLGDSDESKNLIVQEIQSPLEARLKLNEETYELKLKLKTDEVLGAIDSVGQRVNWIADTIEAQHRSLNHEFRHIWTRMNWHYCVDRRSFITGLQEYYTDEFFAEEIGESEPTSPTIDHSEIDTISQRDDAITSGETAYTSQLDGKYDSDLPDDAGAKIVESAGLDGKVSIDIINVQSNSTIPVLSLRKDAETSKMQEGLLVTNQLEMQQATRQAEAYPPPTSIAPTIAGSNKRRVDSKDAWTVTYFSNKYGHEIIDAIDKDSSGFITQREANQFATSKPKELSLPEWIAYWAAGWPAETNIYCSLIESLLDEMLGLKMQSKLLPENTYYMTVYLHSESLNILSTICASLNERESDDVKLNSMVDDLMKRREHILEKRLKAVKYYIDDEDTLRVVCGKLKFESCLLPLLYLILRHHYNVMTLCFEKVVDVRDFWQLSVSFGVILGYVNSRIIELNARITRQRENPQEVLDYYSNGIYKLAHTALFGTSDRSPSVKYTKRYHGSQGTYLRESNYSAADTEAHLQRPCIGVEQYRARIHTKLIPQIRERFSQYSPVERWYSVYLTYAQLCFYGPSDNIVVDVEDSGEAPTSSTNASIAPAHDNVSGDTANLGISNDNGVGAYASQTSTKKKMIKIGNEFLSSEDWLATERAARIDVYPLTSHVYSMCDKCKEYEFHCPRYKCLDCENYDLCSRCFLDELKGPKELHVKTGHLPIHNMMKFIMPFPFGMFKASMSLQKLRWRVAQYMIFAYDQSKLKCGGKCGKEDIEGAIYVCSECENLTCSDCQPEFNLQEAIKQLREENSGDVRSHQSTHKVLVIRDLNVDRYKREKARDQEAPADRDLKDILVEINKRLSKLEDIDLKQELAELKEKMAETVVLKEELAYMKEEMAQLKSNFSDNTVLLQSLERLLQQLVMQNN